MKQREAIRPEKSSDLADADRENSSRRSHSGNQDCGIGYACWAHRSILVTLILHSFSQTKFNLPRFAAEC